MTNLAVNKKPPKREQRVGAKKQTVNGEQAIKEEHSARHKLALKPEPPTSLKRANTKLTPNLPKRALLTKKSNDRKR